LPRSTPNRTPRPGSVVVLGVDPGTLVTGYGVVASDGRTTTIVECGAIKNDGSVAMPMRLKHIYATLAEVIVRHRPTECAVETAFYGKNAQSALKLGQARGVALLAAVNHGLDPSEYSPREVKQAVVGNGNASKDQVSYMVKALLALSAAPKPFDVSDAIAVALCHLHRRASGKPKAASWKAYVAAHPEALRR
jgi:crossover junction endodeoxyribonuclease RuvC